MWIHFDDLPIGTEFLDFFLQTKMRKIHDMVALNLLTNRQVFYKELCHGFSNGYYFFDVKR